MPKIKTSRSAAKRIKFTKSGKAKFKRTTTRHHAWAKTPSQKRHLRKTGMLGKTETKVAHALVPYK